MTEVSRFIEEYPWGKYSDYYVDAVYWLLQNKEKLIKKEDSFDYPDYWDMPDKFSYELSSDEVDWIQECTFDWWN